MTQTEQIKLMWAGLLLKHGLPDHQIPAFRTALSLSTEEAKDE